MKKSKKLPIDTEKKSINRVKKIISIIVSVLCGAIVASGIWFCIQLHAVSSETGQLKRVVIAENSTPSQIAEELQKQGIIRSALAFQLYTRFSGESSNLQAGTYRLSPGDSVSKIVEHLVNGRVSQFQITFFPGATLTDNTANSNHQDVTSVLLKAGFSEQEITEALNADYSKYNNTLFVGRPEGSDLEGYVFGDTYSLDDGASVKDVLEMSFDEFYSKITENNLQEKFAEHGLTLYEGITLASIVQKEAGSVENQKQVAQVFYTRLENNMTLGSDVTYQYIADKTGVTRDPTLDSPYNTRIYKGLTPGPISSPSLSALQAVADPADGDYLFFLAGDDGVMYFAHTDAEHEANITNYCKIGCSVN